MNQGNIISLKSLWLEKNDELLSQLLNDGSSKFHH